MVDPPGGTSGLLVRGYKGKKADRLVTRIDPGVVSLVAELRGHERQAAEELGRWSERRDVPIQGAGARARLDCPGSETPRQNSTHREPKRVDWL